MSFQQTNSIFVSHTCQKLPISIMLDDARRRCLNTSKSVSMSGGCIGPLMLPSSLESSKVAYAIPEGTLRIRTTCNTAALEAHSDGVR